MPAKLTTVRRAEFAGRPSQQTVNGLPQGLCRQRMMPLQRARKLSADCCFLSRRYWSTPSAFVLRRNRCSWRRGPFQRTKAPGVYGREFRAQ